MSVSITIRNISIQPWFLLLVISIERTFFDYLARKNNKNMNHCDGYFRMFHLIFIFFSISSWFGPPRRKLVSAVKAEEEASGILVMRFHFILNESCLFLYHGDFSNFLSKYTYLLLTVSHFSSTRVHWIELSMDRQTFFAFVFSYLIANSKAEAGSVTRQNRLQVATEVLSCEILECL